MVDIPSNLLNYAVTGNSDKEVQEGRLWTDLLPYVDKYFALQFTAEVEHLRTV